jgi:hypothetical protein
MDKIIEVKIDIAGQIAERTRISKEVVAEYLADEIMKFLFPQSSRNEDSILSIIPKLY